MKIEPTKEGAFFSGLALVIFTSIERYFTNLGISQETTIHFIYAIVLISFFLLTILIFVIGPDNLFTYSTDMKKIRERYYFTLNDMKNIFHRGLCWFFGCVFAAALSSLTSMLMG